MPKSRKVPKLTFIQELAISLGSENAAQEVNDLFDSLPRNATLGAVLKALVSANENGTISEESFSAFSKFIFRSLACKTVDPFAAAIADGWIKHPTPGYYYKGQEVKPDADVAALYAARLPDPAIPSWAQ